MQSKVATVGSMRPCNNEKIEREVLGALHMKMVFGFFALFCFVLCFEIVTISAFHSWIVLLHTEKKLVI